MLAAKVPRKSDEAPLCIGRWPLIQTKVANAFIQREPRFIRREGAGLSGLNTQKTNLGLFCERGRA